MPYRSVTTAEAERLLQETRPVVLDLRDRTSFDAGHLPGARHLTDTVLGELMSRRHEPTLVYCYRGNSSKEIARLLARRGFSNLYELDEGWEGWQRRAGGTRIPGTGPGRMTALMKAAMRGDADEVLRLLRQGADIDATNGDGNNALWLACFGGSAAVVNTLIDHGIHLDQRNENGATALMYAASSGKTDLVACLLAAGADPSIRTLDDFSALDLAADIGSLRLLRAATAHP